MEVFMSKKILQWATCALLAASILCIILMYVSAHCVHLQTTHIYLNDLPPAFDGLRVLFVGDIDLTESSVTRTNRLFRDLQSLSPDVLILGGDYTSASVSDIFSDSVYPDGDSQRILHTQFFSELADFSAPLGKFAVLSLDDANVPDIAQMMAQYGIACLADNAVRIDRDFSSLYIAGLYPLSENSAGISQLGANFMRDSCVIACIHSPEGFPSIQISEAADGGSWCDLVLSCGTHDGQIRLFGNPFLPLSARERRYANGWFVENGVKLLVSGGLGCEGLPLRLGTQAQVHLLILHCFT